MSNKVPRNSLRKRVNRAIRETIIGEDDLSYWLSRIDEVIEGFRELKADNAELDDNTIVTRVIHRIEYEDRMNAIEKEEDVGKTREVIARVKRCTRLTFECGLQPLIVTFLLLSFLVVHGKCHLLEASILFVTNVLLMFMVVFIMDIRYGDLGK